VDECKIAALSILGQKAKCFPFLVIAFGKQQLRQQRESHRTMWKAASSMENSETLFKMEVIFLYFPFPFLFLPLLFIYLFIYFWTWNNNINTREREALAYNAYLTKAWDPEGTDSSCATAARRLFLYWCCSTKQSSKKRGIRGDNSTFWWGEFRYTMFTTTAETQKTSNQMRICHQVARALTVWRGTSVLFEVW